MSTEGEPTARARRPRRAVRPSGTVGTDESVLRSAFPAAPESGGVARPGRATGAQDEASPASSTSGAPRPAPAGTEPPDPWSATRSADDSDRGWGREEPSSDDERLRRERPPHW
ncbi:hypothetical protein [Cellulomonas sp.]|uniref:hypothetical protein n=1 Tax=Cellulomonas sp. TaxID=40001 RepID=UPI0028114CC0|nr:hypothetical protein [Cellulomonas sp.]